MTYTLVGAAALGALVRLLAAGDSGAAEAAVWSRLGWPHLSGRSVGLGV